MNYMLRSERIINEYIPNKHSELYIKRLSSGFGNIGHSCRKWTRERQFIFLYEIEQTTLN